jgi:sodium/calcium exchanger protein
MPEAVMGIVIAAVVLLPECLAAFRAAQANRLQTSLNLALGSVLAAIGLTIPAVAAVSIVLRQPLELGLGGKDRLLLVLTLFISAITLSTGRTTVLYGAVHLVISCHRAVRLRWWRATVSPQDEAHVPIYRTLRDRRGLERILAGQALSARHRRKRDLYARR